MTDTIPPGTAQGGPPAGDPPPQRSTRAGGPRLPEILGPWETAVVVWRWLRRMSTALLLLFALAVASIVGTFVPQQPVSPDVVERWRSGAAGPGSAVARVLDGVGAFDLFGSWWFVGLTALLFVSLTGCLIPRVRAFARTVRRQPPAGRNLERLRRSVLLSTDLDPDEAAARARDVLRRARFRVRDVDAHAVAAERGHWREGGSLLFHVAFYVLLVGVVIGNGFGFTGQVNLVEGAPPVTDTRLTYGAATPGRWFGLEDHRGFAVALDEFTVDWHADDTPASYASDVTLTDPDGTTRRGVVRVNEPLRHDGMTIYQIRWGMAPLLRVTAGDREVARERVTMSEAAGGVWTGVLAISTARDRQLALDLALVPDADIAVGPDGAAQIVSASPRPENPRVFADLYAGRLGLERPVPQTRMDRSGGPAVTGIQLAPGQPVDITEDLTVELVDVGEWSGFQVSHQPARWVLVAGSALALAGLVGSLYAYRRRVWVHAERRAGVTQVRVAGVALQRPERFDEEFAQLVERVRRVLPADGDAAVGTSADGAATPLG